MTGSVCVVVLYKKMSLSAVSPANSRLCHRHFLLVLSEMLVLSQLNAGTEPMKCCYLANEMLLLSQ